LLDEVPYPATSVLVESSFWFNRFLQSGKTLISVHSLPDGKSLVVVSMALTIEADALTKYDVLGFRIRDVLMGYSFLMNRDQGFAKGLPPYNQDLVLGLKSRMEEGKF
jgi:hypothetical protein